MRKTIFLSTLILLSFAVVPQKSLGKGPEPQPAFFQTVAPELNLELEYLAPVDKDRQIETVSLNILIKKPEIFRLKQFDSYLGLTLTRAWGSINRTTINPDSSAFGLGPVFLIRKELWQNNRVQLFFDSSVGLIFYSKDFPAGGDFYNFMWRFGPKIKYQIDPNLAWNLSYKWMHVSNGQISHEEPTHNPAYNGVGFSLGLAWAF